MVFPALSRDQSQSRRFSRCSEEEISLCICVRFDVGDISSLLWPVRSSLHFVCSIRNLNLIPLCAAYARDVLTLDLVYLFVMSGLHISVFLEGKMEKHRYVLKETPSLKSVFDPKAYVCWKSSATFTSLLHLGSLLQTWYTSIWDIVARYVLQR